MLTRDQKDLLVFLADTANEVTAKSHWASSSDGLDLRKEAEELMSIRAKLLNRHWETARANQFEFPFELKQAA